MNSMIKAFVALAALASFVTFTHVPSARAGESDGSRYIAICRLAQPTDASNAFVLIYNLSDARNPFYHVVVGWQNTAVGPRRGYTETSVYSPARNFTVPGEEIHFEAAGFKLEVVTNLAAWTDGVMPGTDAAHPEQAFANVWTTINGQALAGAPMLCEFMK